MKNSVLITGSTAGIGFETARVLANQGHKIFLNGRTEEGTSAAVERLRYSCKEADIDGVVCDFSSPIDLSIFPPNIDVLINNVGIYTSKDFSVTSDEDWYAQFEVNCMSGVRLSRHYLPQMLASNYGRILFISSECAYLAPEDMVSYSSTKAALHALSRGLANTTRNSGVTVNTIVPGSTYTEGAERFIEEKAAQQNQNPNQVAQAFIKSERPQSLIERFARTEEVAALIAFYASAQSSAVNGSVIFCEGGSTSATF
jgi:NAD(P)-dependent dehydrogenase (short-subunit alcohol dehydrogenase family)